MAITETHDDPIYDTYCIKVYNSSTRHLYYIYNVLEVMGEDIVEGDVLAIKGIGWLEILDIIPNEYWWAGEFHYEEEWVCEQIGEYVANK